MRVSEVPIDGTQQSFESRPLSLSETEKVSPSNTIIPGSPGSETASGVSALAGGVMEAYETLYDKRSDTTFIVAKGADISDPQLRATLKKTTRVSENCGIGDEVSSEQVERKYQQVTKGLIVKDGKLQKPYTERGKIKYYDTGMTPESLKALLTTSMKTRKQSKGIFHQIAKMFGIKLKTSEGNARNFQVINAKGESQ